LLDCCHSLPSHAHFCVIVEFGVVPSFWCILYLTEGGANFIQLAHNQFIAFSTIPYNLRFWRAKAIGKLSCTWAELEQVKLGLEIAWFALLCATPFRSIFKAIFLAAPRPTSHESVVSFALTFALQTTKLSSKIWNLV
jgi:hypothetical protein